MNPNCLSQTWWVILRYGFARWRYLDSGHAARAHRGCAPASGPWPAHSRCDLRAPPLAPKQTAAQTEDQVTQTIPGAPRPLSAVFSGQCRSPSVPTGQRRLCFCAQACTSRPTVLGPSLTPKTEQAALISCGEWRKERPPGSRRKRCARRGRRGGWRTGLRLPSQPWSSSLPQSRQAQGRPSGRVWTSGRGSGTMALGRASARV